MVLDTSAVVAILFNEPERPQFVAAIDGADRRVVSAVTLVELTMVVEGRLQFEGAAALAQFLDLVAPEILPVSPAQAELARDAFRRFGKGRHPARLNLGDCFAYALAKATGEPLLFKGNGFTKTDIAPAL